MLEIPLRHELTRAEWLASNKRSTLGASMAARQHEAWYFSQTPVPSHKTGDWDATSYHQVSRPHAAWGATVIDRAQLRGDERVLDAGCGSGRVTLELLARLPHGHVVAADVSPAMLDQARSALAPYADRVTLLQADLTELDTYVTEPVDVVFSTATFHWIKDHHKLFTALYAVTKRGGRLVAQCGGGHNLQRFMRAADDVAKQPPYRATLAGRELWRFQYAADETAARLELAGFTNVATWLEDSPQTFDDAAALAHFARTVVLSNHVSVLPAEQRDHFVHAVVEEVSAREGAYLLDYARLNMDALRPS